MKKIAVIGVGAFGYAIIKHLDRNNKGRYVLHIFDVDKEVMNHIKKYGSHKYFHKNAKLTKKVKIEEAYENLIKDAHIVILAVPSNVIKYVIEGMKPYLSKKVIIVNVAKALDLNTGKTLSSTILKEFPFAKYASFAGGTISYDLVAGNPLGADIACKDKKTLKELVEIFNSKELHVYPTTDLEGVEYASSFKNVLSIMAGLVNGLGHPVGTETLMISRGSEEIKNLISSEFGGKKETFQMHTQSWGNDLWMSCMGKTRNRAFGIEIGKSRNVAKSLEKMKKMKYSIEGINTLNVASRVLHAKNNKYPILNALAQIVLQKKDPKKTIDQLIKKSI